MASLESLPADQRAVLELVLQRGRSYDEIAKMLGIDRAGVRQRALSAFDALGPQTRLEPLRRALITDYLLGQLPGRVAEDTRQSLARSAAERAWARVLASELAGLARDPLPEIPAQAQAEAEPAEPAQPGAAAGAARTPSAPPPSRGSAREPEPERRREDERGGISRRGGAILLGIGSLVVVVAIVVVLIVLLAGGSSTTHGPSTVAGTTTAPSTTTTPATTPSTGTTATTATTTTSAKVIAQINLLPPTSASKAKGIAQVITAASTTGVAIYATGMPTNSGGNVYAVWLYNSPTSSLLVGFVSPGVGKDGRLQTEGPFPSTASSYKQLLVTLETSQNKKPKTPGQVILQGTLKLP